MIDRLFYAFFAVLLSIIAVGSVAMILTSTNAWQYAASILLAVLSIPVAIAWWALALGFE
jgi:hypothetical protein